MAIIRAVVFDVYKTLLDIKTDEESLGSYAFLSQWKVFSRLLLDCKRVDFDVESKSQELALLFRILTTKSISVYPGVLKLLSSLKGKARLGIVSNAQRLFTIPELSRFNLIDFFDAIVLSSDAGVRKPHPKIFRSLLDAIAVPPEAAVFVGDNMFDDVYGASSIGMKTIWINRGNNHGASNLRGSAKPDYEILDGSYQALSALLLSML